VYKTSKRRHVSLAAAVPTMAFESFANEDSGTATHDLYRVHL